MKKKKEKKSIVILVPDHVIMPLVQLMSIQRATCPQKNATLALL
jgi:hypothetical protein